jgi:hypothetical protein
MTDNLTPSVDIEIAEDAPKQSLVKKILQQPKKLAVGAGIALALVAGAVWFAVQRMDEEDFEDEASQELDDVIVVKETPVA